MNIIIQLNSLKTKQKLTRTCYFQNNGIPSHKLTHGRHRPRICQKRINIITQN